MLRQYREQLHSSFMWTFFQDWFLGLGAQYGVNPFIFGSIYVGAIPFFSASVAWVVRNLRKKQPIVVPGVLSVLFFVSSYIYLFAAGDDLPWWIYGVLGTMLVGGLGTTVQKIRSKVGECTQHGRGRGGDASDIERRPPFDAGPHLE